MLELLHSEDLFVVVHKPAGLLTQSDGGRKFSLETQVRKWVEKKIGKKPGFVEAVHRLDFSVSGIVIFALSSKAAALLSKQFKNREVQKTYIAVVEGKLPQEGTLEDYIVKRGTKAIISNEKDKEAKKASLHFERLQFKKGCSLVQIALETGRYHQIRVQFSKFGFPIIGDEKYGSTKRHPMDGIALHHQVLSFKHPVSKKELFFKVLPPWIKIYF